MDLLSRYTLSHVVVQWGDQLPSSFNVEISSNPAVSWDSVVQQPAAAGAQQVDLGSTTQWLRIYCNGGCSIQELQVYGTPANGRLLQAQDVNADPILL